MNNELLATLEYIENERGISKEQLVQAVEHAILKASGKSIHPASDLTVKLDRSSGEIKAWAKLKVVENYSTDDKVKDEIRLIEAKVRIPSASVGDIVDWEVTPKNFGRIAAQTARQAILQQLRQAEKDMAQQEYKDKIGEIVNGSVRRIDGGSIIVEFMKSEGIIGPRDRVMGEQYNIGERINALLVKFELDGSGPSLILSRSNPQFVRKLFEREVSEIHDGVVEIMGIARDPGSRSKVVVKSNDQRVDPVGACVGMRGLRVRNITNELGGERIDIIQYEEDIEDFITNAMHPAKLNKIEMDRAEKKFSVFVDEENSRLAFGKKAQNVRLSQRLLQQRMPGWTIAIQIDRSMEEKFNEEKTLAIKNLAEQLSVTEDAAAILVNNGYLTLDGLGHVSAGDLAKIEGVDASLLEAVTKALEMKKKNEEAGADSAE